MLSRIGVVCFASSYAIVFLLELSRLVFKMPIRRAAIVCWAAAGWTAHSFYLYYHAMNSAGVPFASWRDWYFAAAWLVATAYLYLLFNHADAPFGIFLQPLILGLISVGEFWADATPFAIAPTLKAWGAIHGLSLAAALTTIFAGFATGLMYFAQERRLKRKIPASSRIALPTLEWLRRANAKSLTLTLIFLGVGGASGCVMNLIVRRSGGESAAWNDPLPIGALALFVWLAIGSVGGALYRPERQGRKVALLTLVSFAALAATLAFGLFVNTSHVGRASPKPKMTQASPDSTEQAPPRKTNDAEGR